MKIENDIIQGLKKLKFSPNTIRAYIQWAKRLQEFYPNMDIRELSQEEVEAFINDAAHPYNTRFGPHSVHQMRTSLSRIYQDVFGRNFSLSTMKLPKKPDGDPTMISKEEIEDLFNAITNIKHRAVFQTLYETGIKVVDIEKIRIRHFDLNKQKIRVPFEKDQFRDAQISDELVSILKQHLEENQPKIWLFEGGTPGKPLSNRTIQQTFKTILLKARIPAVYSPKDLRYTYLYHKIKEGITLKKALEQVGFTSNASFMRYYKIFSDEFGLNVQFKDDEEIGYEKSKEIIALTTLVTIIPDFEERDYLEEAILCLEAGALRAAVIFSWIAGIRNIQNKLLTYDLKLLNSALLKYNPKSRPLKTIDDFANVKDRDTLEVSRELGIFDKNQKNILVNCLDLRNKCGHPGNYKPKSIKVSAYLEDIIGIIF